MAVNIRRRKPAALPIGRCGAISQCDGLAVETDTRMVNEQRGVLCRITAANNTHSRTDHYAHAARARHIAGGRRRREQRHATQECGVGRAPFAQTGLRDEGKRCRCWTWTVELPAGGNVTLGFVAGDDKAALVRRNGRARGGLGRHVSMP